MSTDYLKKYLLYTLLLFTLGATLFFLYHDYVQVENNEVLSLSIHQVNRSDKQKPQVKEMKLVEFHATTDKRIDIFDVYKKPVVELAKKEVAYQHVKVKENLINTTHQETPPPAISAPPIQLKYIGKIKGDDNYLVFVGFNGKNYVVKEGDDIQQVYKIEKITPPTMTITYIPMGISQTMSIGEPG